MRTVDLAVYADSVAAEAGALSARLERARRRLRQAALEREVRGALPGEVVAELEKLGLLDAARSEHDEPAEIARIQEGLRAVHLLQSWLEARLYRDPERPAEAVGYAVPAEETAQI